LSLSWSLSRRYVGKGLSGSTIAADSLPWKSHFILLVLAEIYSSILLGISCPIEYLFEPLKELEIILIFAFNQLFDVDMPCDSKFGKALLQNLEVIYVLILAFGLEIDLAKWDLIVGV
jgi:hypothetical protein